jgi:hypothetical protein
MTVQIPAIALSDVELNATTYKEAALPAGEFLNAAHIAEPGEPDVPVITTLIAIPDRAGVRLHVTHSGYDTFENIDLAPTQSPQPESDPTPLPFVVDNEAYATDAFFPGELAEASEPAIMRDVRVTSITLQPVQYNPARRELRVYRELSVSVTYDGEVVNPKATRHRYLSEGFYPIYKSMIANFEEMFAGADVRRGGYYMIIKRNNADSLRVDSLLQQVALWKHQKGYPVRIVPTTEINSNGSPTYTRIRDFLVAAYDTCEVPPEYVMLVGPQDGTFIINDYPYSYHPSDHEYACLDGTDYLPEIFVARMSLSNMAEMRRGINKIFKYERNPQMFDPLHWVRGLSVGHPSYETARLITLWVRSLMMRNGWARVDTIYYDGHNQAVINYLNNGRSMIQYRGYGSTEGWWGGFTVSNLNSVQTNQKLGVMAVLTCGTGDFDDGYACLAEAWLRCGVNPDSLKGGPAYYGVSDHGTYTPYNNPIMFGYYWGIFGDNTYHFAPAAIRGKMQLYMTYPRNRGDGSTIDTYFHTYNMFGDPELELRTAIPKYLVVTHEDTLPLGRNFLEINVSDSLGHPVSGAYVTLLKGTLQNEESYSVEKTDDWGYAMLRYGAATAGPMALTVSGQNLVPYLRNIEIVVDDVAVGVDSIAIDDDLVGHSYGNGDSLAGPNETLELAISLKNFGSNLTAMNVKATLESLDDKLTVYDGVRGFGDIAPDSIRANGLPFVVHAASNALDGDVLRLKLNIEDDNEHAWQSLVEIPISGPRFTIHQISVFDENNRLNRGDTANLVLTIFNRGTVDAADVMGYVTSNDDYGAITGAACNFGNLPVDSSGANTGTPVTAVTPPEVFEGHAVNFILHLSTASGSEMTIPFTVPVGVVSTSDPTGPDAYGYYMYDKTDTTYAPHPTYNWINTSPHLGGQGTRLSFSNGDDMSILIPLPFEIVYYGKAYDSLLVCTNGFVAFDKTRMDISGRYWADFRNYSIPDPGNTVAQISPFWDDLILISGNTKGIFTWHDTTNHLFYIEYDSVRTVSDNGNALEWFEVIFTDPAYHPTLTGDSEIMFQYRVVNNSDANEVYASVGIEDESQMVGLQYTYDRTYPTSAVTLANTMAIKITTNTGRGGIRGTVLLGGEDNSGATVRTSTGQQRVSDISGLYWIRYVAPGEVSLSAEKEGYFPEVVAGLQVQADQTLTVSDITLEACPIPTGIDATDTVESLIQVTWNAVLHPNLTGYNLLRSKWESGQFVPLNNEPLPITSFVDATVPDTGIYWYYVTAVYSTPEGAAQSLASARTPGSILSITGTDDGPQIPAEFYLAQNYPNPFNPTTSISYGLPRDSHVRIDIFNLLGQRIRTLLNEDQRAGYKSVVWDGRDAAGQSVASGVYLYRLKAGEKEMSRKMLMLK